MGQDIDAVGLDPYKTTALASLNYFEQIYNSLLQFDGKGACSPSWPSPGRIPIPRPMFSGSGKM